MNVTEREIRSVYKRETQQSAYEEAALAQSLREAWNKRSEAEKEEALLNIAMNFRHADSAIPEKLATALADMTALLATLLQKNAPKEGRSV